MLGAVPHAALSCALKRSLLVVFGKVRARHAALPRPPPASPLGHKAALLVEEECMDPTAPSADVLASRGLCSCQ